MRCKCPLDISLCPLDKHFLHSYGSYDSTTITPGLLPTRQATRQVSIMRCKSPLESSLCRVDKHFLHSYGSTTITPGLLPTRQATKFRSLLNEMQKSTRQFTLSGGQTLSPLVRLDYHYTGSLANKTGDKVSKSP